MSMNILGKPVVTEKSMQAAQKGRYTFSVNPLATKGQIVDAIKESFGVDADTVHTVTLPGKKKRTGKRRVVVQTRKTKKAMVILRKGQTIPMFDVEKQA